MKNLDRQHWTNALPDTFKTFLGDRNVEEVECIVPDMAGISRGKAMPAYKFAEGGVSFLPDSIFYQTITGSYVDMKIENQWTESDMVMRPDYATACASPWADDVTLQIIHDLEHRDGSPVAVAPRNVLKRVLGHYHDRGWQPVVAPELEFYLTKPNIDPNQPIEPPTSRTGRRGAGRQAYSMVAVDDYGPVIDTIYDFAEAQGLKIETVIQEGGAGQIEINLRHGDPLTLADQVFYFKRSIREAALKNGNFATFMAKPMRHEPGSAMHLHQSIIDIKSGQNIFSLADGSPSDAFGFFIGGLQTHLNSVFALLAPYANSYRRFQREDSSPTNLEWARDNRSTGIRVPISGPEDRRVENRIIGMDCNPYLAFAGSLACGYLGLVEAIAPRPARQGDHFEETEKLPRYLEDSLELFADASRMRTLLGEGFCSVFEAIKRAEAEDFHNEISPWEREHLLLNV